MVAPRRRPAHLGAPHAPAGPRKPPPAGHAPWALAARTGLRRAQPAGAAHSRRTASQLSVRGASAGGDAGTRGSAPPRPHPAVRVRDGERTYLRRAPGAAGRARERRRSRTNEWSRRLLAGHLRPVPGRTARSCQGGCGHLPLSPNARLLVAGRPRPTVPSADVTH
ncbi:uncharacterized protein LOC105723907 [Aotus nancymaae]|uniref:uncharacterized protein LOC105723907 n=1 Tax=Aotus nancymaae TaxID=37293 RepID=UPI0006268E9A|nr:uncharacterized protein LOC105723907 [Aotus nancymaae]